MRFATGTGGRAAETQNVIWIDNEKTICNIFSDCCANV